MSLKDMVATHSRVLPDHESRNTSCSSWDNVLMAMSAGTNTDLLRCDRYCSAIWEKTESHTAYDSSSPDLLSA